jgi:hypothetical protein
MKVISTSIIINTKAEKVWDILSKYDNYPNWNPFIRSIEGEVKVGKTIKVLLTPPDANPMIFKPKVIVYKENSELQWLGHLLIPGLFDGQHIFRFEEVGDNSVKFIQEEVFRGLLVGLFTKMLDNNTKRGFILMNEKLKELCEK